MTAADLETIVTIAAYAALADGKNDESERRELAAVATRLGVTNADEVVARAMAGGSDVATLAHRLSTGEARRAAFEVAVAMVRADGKWDDSESAFLRDLAAALGPDAAAAVEEANLVKATIPPFGPMPIPDAAAATAAASVAAAAGTSASGGTPAPGALDSWILDQAMIAGAVELLPDRLANMAVLPLQLRMVYTIGQKYGQQLDLAQAKDLAGAMGIGVAAQVMEGVVRRTLGGLAGGLLGGLLGGTAGNVSGAAVTFASTYALGHAAERYYAQGRQLSMSDVKQLFERLKGEANTIYPRVQDRIRDMASTRKLSDLVPSLGR
jgi:uncharacterized protein (DUF697 family)/uncharacterized tellurite resistance protein B-like protein